MHTIKHVNNFKTALIIAPYRKLMFYEAQEVCLFFSVPGMGGALVDASPVECDSTRRTVAAFNNADPTGTRGVWELTGPKGKRLFKFDPDFVRYDPTLNACVLMQPIRPFPQQR